MQAGSAFHAELVEDLYDAAEQQGYDVVLSAVTRTRSEGRAAETLVDFRCEALVLLGPVAPAAQLAALGRQLPVVVIGRRVAAGVDVVRSADAKGVGQAVDHLAGLGHRSIAYVDGGRGTIAADRRRGYRTAMRRRRLAAQVRVIGGDHTEAAGARAARLLLDEGRPLPSAVVAYNDHCAVGLLDTLNRAGVEVPAELSVVGYDDTSLSRLAHVNLTTVSQDARGQAEHAVAAAVERLDGGRTTPSEVVLAPHLVVRGTTGPPSPEALAYPRDGTA